MSQKQLEGILKDLRKNETGARAVVEIGNHVGNERGERCVVSAQKFIAEYIRDNYGGDIEKFLERYGKNPVREKGKVLIRYGRKQLGL